MALECKLNDGRVVIQFLSQALNNEPLTIYGNGEQTRSLCYIDDLIRGLYAYANSEICQPINLGNDSEIKVVDLAKMIIATTESKSKITFKELPADDPPQRRPDLSLAKKLLRYEYKIPIEEGIKLMLSSTRHSSSV